MTFNELLQNRDIISKLASLHDKNDVLNLFASEGIILTDSEFEFVNDFFSLLIFKIFKKGKLDEDELNQVSAAGLYAKLKDWTDNNRKKTIALSIATVGISSLLVWQTVGSVVNSNSGHEYVIPSTMFTWVKRKF
ncbi:MAG: hypothetical protein NkDv07_0003 [Candidatus Improbicoccus devescovinae]|nr:MAG: hypothetical protein NkDv07_0003 [Candidatus Improbicoccus devescovinae]